MLIFTGNKKIQINVLHYTKKKSENSLSVVCESELKLIFHRLLVTILETDTVIIPHRILLSSFAYTFYFLL